MDSSNLRAVLAALLLALPLLCVRAGAQTRLDGIDWQVAREEDKRTLPFNSVRELKLEPYRKYPYKLRAVVSVRNDQDRPVEGLVLRYALSLHIVKASDPSDTGFWAVPFRVDELRISQIKAGETHEAKLIHFILNGQLRKLNNTGFWVDALKLQLMLDPKRGDDPAVTLREDVIRIVEP